jgi:predicted nucleotidyltransferase
MDNLLKAGFLTQQRIGNQLHYQANRENPLFDELRSIALKTGGLAEPVREALAPLADRIDVAFIFGSIASGLDHAGSDVDVFVVADDVSYGDTFAYLQRAETIVGRRINPTIFTPHEMQMRVGKPHGFTENVMDGPKIFLIGSDDELRAIREPGETGAYQA